MTTQTQRLHSPSALISYIQSPFCAWMERASKIDPKRFTPDEVSDETQLLFDKGNQHERKYIDQLKAEGRQVLEITGNTIEECRHNTLLAIHEGVEVIVQADLVHSPFQGRADFLFRVEEPSTLGNYHYTLGDMKLSKRAKPTHLMQLCVYAEMLQAIQGILPQHIEVIVGDGSREPFVLNSIWHAYQQVRSDFLAFHDAFDITQPPNPIPGELWGKWASHAERILDEQDHLIRVANITQGQIKKLQGEGIHTFTQLAETTLDHIPKLARDVFTTLKTQAQLQQQSVVEGKPAYRIKPPSDKKRGLAALPPASPADIFFDIEGDPFIKGGLEYLFGVTTVNPDGTLAFKDWWAHNALEEKQLLESFMDWVMARYQADPTLHIYHYANYEIAALRKLMGRYGTREAEVDHLLRNEVFVDLYKVVSQGLMVGMPSYSIKDIEQVFRPKRSGEVQSGGASIVMYEQWRENPDGDTWDTSAILKSIRDYNQEDTDSTYYVTEWLRRLQQEHGIGYQPAAIKEEKKETPDDGSQVLIEKLLADIPEAELALSSKEMPETVRLKVLLAHLVDFYRREAKPFWWAYFDRKTLTGYELMDDADCIGACQRTATPPIPEKQSLLFEFSFDPRQEYKLRQGDKVAVLWGDDAEAQGELFLLDKPSGLLQIKISKKNPYLEAFSNIRLTDDVSLIPKDHQPTDSLHASLLKTITQFQETGELRPCLRDFLLRLPPAIHGHTHGPLINEDYEVTPQTIALSQRLQETCLCIQGPPGTGKSHTGSRMILEWLKAGKRVGIASNSHKAINNLMHKVVDVAAKESYAFTGCKIRAEREEEWEPTSIQQISSAVNINDTYQLIGGTAWAFSNEALKDQLDVLVIDEAGQVSLANLVAMSRSAKTIVLLGDPMQLPQPLQGSHPGESGQSALEYYLQDHATIPPEQGIFLNVTYRCPAEITDFISEMAYDSRLLCHDDTRYREIQHGAESPWLSRLNKPSGIVFIPVVHEGNSQSSEEEAAVIQQLVRELLTATYQHGERAIRPMTLSDILVVAPYNQQVFALQEALGPEAKVGSVDKFQGQEAPVVIVSLCASNAENSPRGMEFLLSKNRLNVALSRAQALAIVVGSPALAKPTCQTIPQLQLVNPFAKLLTDFCMVPSP